MVAIYYGRFCAKFDQSQVHGIESGGQDVRFVDLVGRDGNDGVREFGCYAQESGFSAIGGELFRVEKTGDVVIGRNDDGGDDHGARDGAAARFIYARYIWLIRKRVQILCLVLEVFSFDGLDLMFARRM